MIPIARRICRDQDELKNFLNRHLDFFNAHPYMASYAVGALTRLEEQSIFQKWDDKRPITIFKERICGPLGAIGDALFWQFVKPFSAIIGVIMSLMFGFVGVIFFLVIFNIPHIYFRINGIFKGYFKGFDIIRDLSISGTRKYFSRLNSIMSIFLGILTVIAGYWIYIEGHGKTGIFVYIPMFFLSAGLAYGKKLSMIMIMVIMISISILIGLMIQQ
jgi:mannose/fructose/N-acetylgalactosamine-specific phosphotransferase system component IID